jgi:DNA-binding winged helix-turn-helix (wHTH) protein
MADLRRKLAAPSSSGPIHTYPGVGYLLEHDVTRPSTERQVAGARTRLLRAV